MRHADCLPVTDPPPLPSPPIFIKHQCCTHGFWRVTLKWIQIDRAGISAAASCVNHCSCRRKGGVLGRWFFQGGIVGARPGSPAPAHGQCWRRRRRKAGVGRFLRLAVKIIYTFFKWSADAASWSERHTFGPQYLSISKGEKKSTAS